MATAFILSSAVVITPIKAQTVEIEISDGQVKPTPIAVAPFTGDSKYAQEITQIIVSDLESSGLFHSVNPRGFNQTTESILTEGPRFSDWKMLGADCLLVGSVEVSGGQVRLQFRLFDVMSGTQLTGFELSVDENKWRRVAHMVADQVYSRITGETGYFNSQIAFIEELGAKGRHRAFRLAVMDYDGANVRYLTDGKNIVLSPRISPKHNEIAYLAFTNNNTEAHVHLCNLETGDSRVLGKFNGLNQSPRFSPDGSHLLFSLEKGDRFGIYSKNLSTGEMRALTNSDSTDVSPCYSPDGQRVVFASDRGGTLQLYVMNSDGSNVNRITFDAGRHHQPAWSPKGDYIACTRSLPGEFQIRVMKPDGTEARTVFTSGQVAESPTWSPNGRVIMFRVDVVSKKGVSKIYAVDVTGRGLRQIKTPREASDGCWGDLLDSVSADG